MNNNKNIKKYVNCRVSYEKPANVNVKQINKWLENCTQLMFHKWIPLKRTNENPNIKRVCRYFEHSVDVYSWWEQYRWFLCSSIPNEAIRNFDFNELLYCILVFISIKPFFFHRFFVLDLQEWNMLQLNSCSTINICR